MSKDRVFELCDLVCETGFDIHRYHGPGHLEKVYENALAHRLRKKGLKVEQQHSLKVYDQDGTVLGDYYADLFIEDMLIVEAKAARTTVNEHVAQLLGYLRAARVEHGLLVNFGAPVFFIKKYVMSDTLATPQRTFMRFVCFFLFFAFFCALCGNLFAAQNPPAQPNIIFILSDDLAQGDLGCYGQKLIQTPRLDRMAREGTRYTQAYCGTSVCAPSRASLITGLHSGHCPVRGNWEIKPEGQLPLPADTVTVAQILKGAGYTTACMGKWGMGMFHATGSPLKKGFDHFFGYNCQRHAHSYFPTNLYRDDQPFELPGNDGKSIGKTYAQNLIQEDVLMWVRAQKDRPFFLFYAITLPHGRHEIDDLGIYADKPWTQQRKSYAAQVTRLDRDVGQLLDLLKELSLDEKTLVMLAGDNGSSFAPNSEMGRLFNQAGNGLRGFKRGLYEGALRQAALARWPGVVPAGRVSEEPWAFWDFLPTAAELAGARLPPECKTDGLSLVAFLKGGPAPKRDCFYWELHETQNPLQAVRFGDWKAVKNGPQAALELYDLAADPAEKNNLAAQKPDLVAKAKTLMTAAHTDDPNWPLTGKAKRRLADEKGAFPAQPQKTNATPANSANTPAAAR